LDDFNRAIELNPKFWLFYHFRGRLYDTLQYYDEAVESYDKSISLYPRDMLSHRYRGHVYWLLGRYDLAVKDADRALELNPSDYFALRYRSLCHWVEGREDLAVEDIRTAIKLHPVEVRSYLHLGFYMHSLNRVDQAQGYFTRAEEMNPDARKVIELTIKLSKGPRTRSFYENEVAVIKSYLAGEPPPAPQNLPQEKPLSGEKADDDFGDLEMPDFPIVLEGPGGDDYEFFDLMESSRFDEAIDLAGRRITQDPGNADNYYLRSLAYRRMRRFDAALADIDKAISLSPGDYALIFGRGETYLESRRYDLAAAEFSQALQLAVRGEIYVSPTREEIYQKRAAAHWWKGRIDQVVEDCSQALDSEFPDPGAHLLRSQARWVSGDSEGAIQDAEAAVDFNPFGDAAHLRLAFFLQKTGRKTSALTHFREAFRLNPGTMSTIYASHKQAESERVKRFYQEVADETRHFAPNDAAPDVQDLPADEWSIDIYEVQIKPERIATGDRVELSVEFRIDDKKTGEGQVSVELTYFILAGTDVLLQDSDKLYSGLGQTSVANTVFAAGERGNYSVRFRLRYKGKTAERTVPLVIR
jgi:tetratricopeptide (TPR) repeat protein